MSSAGGKSDAFIPDGEPLSVSASATVEEWTFRKCLRLCIPALIAGSVLRFCFLIAIPEAFYGSDSPSYFESSDKLWNRHRLVFKEKRRWLYPVLLLPLPALPVSPARSIPILQHLVGLATVVGVGWIVGSLTRYRYVWVLLVTTIVAMSPALLWREHEVVAEAYFLGAFVLTIALALPRRRLIDQRNLLWFLLAAASVAALKPAGRGLWLGCMIFAVFAAGNPLNWKWRSWAVVGLGIVAILTMGEKRQAKWLLLSSSLPLVDLEGADWKQYREALRPMVLRARSELDQYAWTQSDYKKPLGDGDPSTIDPRWAELTHRESEYVKVCGVLAREAIVAHPFSFAKLALTKAAIAFSGSKPFQRKFIPVKFWEVQSEEIQKRWRDNPRELELFYRMDQPRFEGLRRERQIRPHVTIPLLQMLPNNLPWMHDQVDAATQKNKLSLTWLGILALGGFIVCLTPARALNTTILWLPLTLYVTVVFAVADRLPQYTEPVEWILLVLAAIGLDALLIFGGSFLPARLKSANPGISSLL